MNVFVKGDINIDGFDIKGVYSSFELAKSSGVGNYIEWQVEACKMSNKLDKLQELLELIKQEQSIVEEHPEEDEHDSLLEYSDGLYDAYQMVIEKIERMIKENDR